MAVSMPLAVMRKAKVEDNKEKAQQVKTVPMKKAESGDIMLFKLEKNLLTFCILFILLLILCF